MSAPDAAEMLQRARDIAPVLAANASEGRAAYRLSAKSISAMREAGFFRILQPRRCGGYELAPQCIYEAEMILAQGDMSAAWILGVSGVISWLAALFDARAADEIWGGGGDEIFCCALRRAGTATPVAGGYRLAGSWTYASGCDYSGWAVLGALVPGMTPAPQDHLLLLAPRADFEIVETWRAPGMQATGSHDVVVRDAFVPAHRAIRMIDNLNCTGPGQAVHDAPLYRLPFGQIFGAGVSVAAAGALQAMLDAFGAGARERKRMGSSIADDPDAQFACAEAAGAIDLAHLIIARNFSAMMEDAKSGVTTPIPARLLYKYQLSTITERCRQAAMRILDLSGTAGLSDRSPMPPLMADISAARQHITNQVVLHGRDLGWSMLGQPDKLDFMV